MTHHEITEVKFPVPAIRSCDKAVIATLENIIGTIFPDGLLVNREPVLLNEDSVKSLMFSLPFALVSPHNIELLNSEPRRIKVKEEGEDSPIYHISANGAEETVEVGRDGFVLERCITVRQIPPIPGTEIRLVAVREGIFGPQQVFKQGGYAFKTIVVFVGLETKLNKQTCSGFVLVK